MTDVAETDTSEPQYPNRFFHWHEGKTKIYIGEPPTGLVGVLAWRIVYKDPDDLSRCTYDAFVVEDEVGTGPGPWSLTIHASGALFVHEPAKPEQPVVIYAPGSWLTARPILEQRFPDTE